MIPIIQELNKLKYIPLLFCATTSLLLFSSCSTEHYKQDADREVYQILDKKWKSDFGPKPNYSISNSPDGPNDINEDRILPDDGVLSLAKAVELATARSRTYQSQKESLYLSALDLTLQRHNFNPRFFGLVSGGYSVSDQEEYIYQDREFGFNQLLADGTQISTSIALDWLQFLTGDPRSTLVTVLSASVTKPLLRGSNRKIVQEQLTQAERNVLYDMRSFNRFRKEFVVSIVNDYYRVLQLLDGVENALYNYENLKIYQDQAQMMADTGRRPHFEADQARQRTLEAEDSYIQALEQYKLQLDLFKLTLAIPTDAYIKLDPNELFALEQSGMTDLDFEVGQAVASALDFRLDLSNFRDQVQDAQRKVDVAADNLAAELNLIGSARVESKEKTNFTNLQFHRGDYGLGFEADLPLDRKAERNVQYRPDEQNPQEAGCNDTAGPRPGGQRGELPPDQHMDEGGKGARVD